MQRVVGRCGLGRECHLEFDHPRRGLVVSRGFDPLPQHSHGTIKRGHLANRLFVAPLEHSVEQVELGGEVVADTGVCNTGLGGNLTQPAVAVAGGCEHLEGRRQDHRSAGLALRVTTRRGSRI